MDALLLATLFSFAIEVGGYKEFCTAEPAKCAPPAVVFAPEGQLKAKLGGHVLYGRSPDLVVISERYKDNPGARVVLEATAVHEMVHVLQWRAQRHMGKTDCNRAAREYEAYRTMNAYYARNGYGKVGDKVVEDLLRRCEMAKQAGLVK